MSRAFLRPFLWRHPVGILAKRRVFLRDFPVVHPIFLDEYWHSPIVRSWLLPFALFPTNSYVYCWYSLYCLGYLLFVFFTPHDRDSQLQLPTVFMINGRLLCWPSFSSLQMDFLCDICNVADYFYARVVDMCYEDDATVLRRTRDCTFCRGVALFCGCAFSYKGTPI
jgi:hypothetical protein